MWFMRTGLAGGQLPAALPRSAPLGSARPRPVGTGETPPHRPTTPRPPSRPPPLPFSPPRPLTGVQHAHAATRCPLPFGREMHARAGHALVHAHVRVCAPPPSPPHHTHTHTVGLARVSVHARPLEHAHMATRSCLHTAWNVHIHTHTHTHAQPWDMHTHTQPRSSHTSVHTHTPWDIHIRTHSCTRSPGACTRVCAHTALERAHMDAHGCSHAPWDVSLCTHVCLHTQLCDTHAQPCSSLVCTHIPCSVHVSAHTQTYLHTPRAHPHSSTSACAEAHNTPARRCTHLQAEIHTRAPLNTHPPSMHAHLHTPCTVAQARPCLRCAHALSTARLGAVLQRSFPAGNPAWFCKPPPGSSSGAVQGCSISSPRSAAGPPRRGRFCRGGLQGVGVWHGACARHAGTELRAHGCIRSHGRAGTDVRVLAPACA